MDLANYVLFFFLLQLPNRRQNILYCCKGAAAAAEYSVLYVTHRLLSHRKFSFRSRYLKRNFGHESMVDLFGFSGQQYYTLDCLLWARETSSLCSTYFHKMLD